MLTYRVLGFVERCAPPAEQLKGSQPYEALGGLLGASGGREVMLRRVHLHRILEESSLNGGSWSCIVAQDLVSELRPEGVLGSSRIGFQKVVTRHTEIVRPADAPRSRGH